MRSQSINLLCDLRSILHIAMTAATRLPLAVQYHSVGAVHFSSFLLCVLDPFFLLPHSSFSFWLEMAVGHCTTTVVQLRP